MRGRCKLAVVKTLSLFPFGDRLYFLLRRTVGQLRHMSRSPQLRHACTLLRLLRADAGRVQEQRVVESETGRTPIVCLAQDVCGAQIDASDTERLVRPSVLRQCLEVMERWAEAARTPLQAIHRRLEKTSILKQALSWLNGSYLTRWVTRRRPFKDAVVDVGVSNLVLQCVREDQQLPLVAKTNRVFRPGGLALHWANLTCEYFSNGPVRRPLYSLRLDGATRNRWFSHRLKHLNPLRRIEFLKLFEQAGFSVVKERACRDVHAAGRWKGSELAERFCRLDWKEPSMTAFEIVLRRPAVFPIATPFVTCDKSQSSEASRLYLSTACE